MTRTNDHRFGRRPVLKAAGIGIAGIGGLASPVAGRRDKKSRGNGKGRENNQGGGGRGGGGLSPLEDSPSLVANLAYTSLVPPPSPPFGYPDGPVLQTFDPGVLFNTRSAEVNPNGQVIHYQLQFGANSKPYVLTHVEDGLYISRGSVINFELDSEDPALGLDEGAYRATVRDRVQLYEKGGPFDWSVTRIDIFSRPGMNFEHSSLVIVWDEDGPKNENPAYRNTPNPVDPEEIDDIGELGVPEYSPEILPDVYRAIDNAAEQLIDAGPSNPGGQ